jgi:hypothetical protein
MEGEAQEPFPMGTPPPEEPAPPAPQPEQHVVRVITTNGDSKLTVKDYNGDRSKYQTFKDQIDLYFNYYEDQIPGDRKRILFVLSN